MEPRHPHKKSIQPGNDTEWRLATSCCSLLMREAQNWGQLPCLSRVCRELEHNDLAHAALASYELDLTWAKLAPSKAPEHAASHPSAGLMG